MGEGLVSQLEALQLVNRHIATCDDSDLLSQLTVWRDRLTQWVQESPHGPRTERNVVRSA